MVSSTSTLLTDEEFLALPEKPGKQELLDGELIESPPSKNSRDKMQRRIAALLTGVIGDERVWIESGYQLGPRRWQQPDVSVTWPEQRIVNDYKQGSPMIAVEIASQGNTDQEMERKRLLYLEHGAAEVWIIYPATRTMMVSTPSGAQVFGADDEYRCEALGLTVTPEYRTPVEP